VKALKLLKALKGTKDKAKKVTALEARQLVCQEGTPCDCHGCDDSG